MDASKKSREEGFTKRLEAFKLKMKRLYVLSCAAGGLWSLWCHAMLASTRPSMFVGGPLSRAKCTIARNLPPGTLLQLLCIQPLFASVQADVPCAHRCQTHAGADEGAPCDAQARGSNIPHCPHEGCWPTDDRGEATRYVHGLPKPCACRSRVCKNRCSYLFFTSKRTAVSHVMTAQSSLVFCFVQQTPASRLATINVLPLMEESNNVEVVEHLQSWSWPTWCAECCI